ncbi:mat1-1-2, partial [Metarhizium hybridum]
MESICQFSPLWRRSELVSKPQKAIEELRLQSLKLFLNRHRSQEVRNLTLNGTPFQSPSHDNEILQRIRDISMVLRTSPIGIVEATLRVWYASSVPVFTRDPQDGLPLDSAMRDTRNDVSTLTWSRSYSTEQHEVGNLGLMAMLMTSENWLPPKHPNLKAASLVSSAVTTMLFASYLICPQLLRSPGSLSTTTGQTDEALALFIKASYQVACENFDKFDSPPGSEFGATPDEMKLSHNGNRFLTKIGCNTWSEPAYWHPCRKVPGSNWNKFIRNSSRPIFPTTSPLRNELVVVLPSTLFGLAQPWAVYYNTLRVRFSLVSSF